MSATLSFTEMRANGSSLKALSDTSISDGLRARGAERVKEAFDDTPHVFCLRQPSPIVESLVTKTGASRPWMCRL